MRDEEARSRPETASKRRQALVGSLRLLRAPAKPISRPLERHYDRRYRGRYRFALALFFADFSLLALALALVSVSVSYLAVPVRPGAIGPIALTIATDPAVPRAGDPLAVTVTVRNLGQETIGDAVLDLRVPPGFRAMGEGALADKIGLGDLASGAAATVTGNFLAVPSATASSSPHDLVIASVAGTVGGKAVGYETEKAVAFSGQALTLDVALPDTLTPKSRIEASISVTNGAAVPLGPLDLVVCPAGSVAIEGSGQGCPVIGLGELAPGSVATSSVAILVGDGAGSDGAIGVRVVFRDSSAGTLAELKERIAVSRKPLALGFPVGPSVVSGSDGVTIGTLVDALASSSVRSFGLALSDGANETLVYSSDAVAERKLAELGEAYVPARLARGYSAGATLVAVPLPYAGPGSETLSESLALPDPFAPGFSASPRYRTADGEQIGRGPVPPAVGETTEYWIFWDLAPTGRPLASIEASATLPEGVSWVGKIGGATGNGTQPTYDPDRRTVSWKASAPAGSVPQDGLGVGFAVSVTPGEADAGKTLPLLGPTDFIVTTADGVQASGEAPAVGTADSGEPGAVVAGE